MSQEAVEGVLGRLITDPEFRNQFFERRAGDPAYLGELSPQEISLLAELDQISIEVFADSLDPRIVRAGTTVSNHRACAAQGQRDQR